MINVTLPLHDALDLLKSNDLPSGLRAQIVYSIRNEIATIHSDVGKSQNRVLYLEAEIRGVIDFLYQGHPDFNSNAELLVHLKGTL